MTTGTKKRKPQGRWESLPLLSITHKLYIRNRKRIRQLRSLVFTFVISLAVNFSFCFELKQQTKATVKVLAASIYILCC